MTHVLVFSFFVLCCTLQKVDIRHNYTCILNTVHVNYGDFSSLRNHTQSSRPDFFGFPEGIRRVTSKQKRSTRTDWIRNERMRKISLHLNFGQVEAELLVLEN